MDAQPRGIPPDQPMTVTLTAAELNMVMQALADSITQRQALIASIQRQCMQQWAGQMTSSDDGG